MTFDTNPDGSTKHIFVQISEFHGFAVVDFATQQGTAADHAAGCAGRQEEPHDARLAVARHRHHARTARRSGPRASGTTSWPSYSMPDLKFLGMVPTGHDPDWLTFSPDSKTVYVACAGLGFRERGGRQHAQGDGADSRRAGAEAKHHGGAAVGRGHESHQVTVEAAQFLRFLAASPLLAGMSRPPAQAFAQNDARRDAAPR